MARLVLLLLVLALAACCFAEETTVAPVVGVPSEEAGDSVDGRHRGFHQRPAYGNNYYNNYRRPYVDYSNYNRYNGGYNNYNGYNGGYNNYNGYNRPVF